MQRPLAPVVVVVLGLAAVFAGCDASRPDQPGTLVVEAFMRSGEPLDTLVLRQTLPLAARSEGAAEGADVRVRIGGERVSYRAVGHAPGRYVPERRLVAAPHASFAIRVEWNGQTATAEGRLPAPIRLDTAVVRVPNAPVRTVLLDSLRRDSLDVPAEQGYIYPIEVDLRWTAPVTDPAETESWIQTRLRPFDPFSSRVIDFFLQPEDVFREHTAAFGSGVSGSHGTGRKRYWTGVYALPVDSAAAPLPRHRLRVGLVRGDSTYARFARTQGVPDQREPLGTVRGALGIVAGVAVDERTLTIGPGKHR